MWEAIGLGFSLGLWLAISLGPIVFTVIKQSLDYGRKGGLAFISGIAVSDLIMATCANLFTGFFISLAAYKQQMEIISAIFLVLVGIYFLFIKKAGTPEAKHELPKFRKQDYAKMFGAGMVTNFLNPGIIVVWLTTATTFQQRTVNEKFVIFGLGLLMALGADITKVLLASLLRKKLTPQVIHRINQATGVIVILFGLVFGIIGLTGKHAIHH